MSAGQNHYAVLGLHPSADDWVIRRTYKRLIRAAHPDVSGEDSAARAAELNAAYDVLGDPERRREWDRDLGNILRGWTDKRRLRWWEVRARHCLQCGELLHPSNWRDSDYRSRRRDTAYCSNACRQKAYRARKAALEKVLRELPRGRE